MNVYVSNYDEAYNLLKNTVESKDILFAAFDCEFSGLRLQNAQRWGYLDTPFERYSGLREVVNSFCLFQVGVCLFYQVENHIECLPISFNVFPQNQIKVVEGRFLFEPGSMKFLRKNGFDFNRLIDDGLPILPQDDEQRYVKIWENKRKREAERFQAKKRVEPGPDDLEFCQKLKSRLATFVVSTESELVLENMTSGFQRLLVYQMLEFDFPLLRAKKLESEKERPKMIISRSGSTKAEENDQKYKEKKQELKETLERHQSIARLFKLLRSNNIPLVGHNCMLDIGYIYRNVVGLLPEKIDAFRTKFSEVFGTVFDLKLVLSRHPGLRKLITSTNLEDAFAFVKNPKSPIKYKSFSLHETAAGYDDSEKEHEAGFDALITGQAFASILSFISGSEISEIDFALALPEYRNRVHQARSLLPHLSLSQDLAEEWKTSFSCIVGDSDEFLPYSEIKRHLSKIPGLFDVKSRRTSQWSVNEGRYVPGESHLVHIWERQTNAFGDLLKILSKMKDLKNFPLKNLRLYFSPASESTASKREREEEERVSEDSDQPPRKRLKSESLSVGEEANHPVISPATALSNLAIDPKAVAAESASVRQ